MEDVPRLRSFNRFITRRVGALDDRYLGRNRPLAAARLLYEVESGASVRALRARLGLDAGYLSRLLRSLETDGLVEITPDPADSRVRLVALTELGRREVDEQQVRADRMIGGLLDGLTTAQRRELVAAVGKVEKLLRLASLRIEVVDRRSADAVECLTAYAAEVGVDAVEEIGTFVVAYDEQRPVGCGAVCVSGEIRHVWVHPDARDLGVANRIRAELSGHRAVRLDAGQRFEKAR